MVFLALFVEIESDEHDCRLHAGIDTHRTRTERCFALAWNVASEIEDS